MGASTRRWAAGWARGAALAALVVMVAVALAGVLAVDLSPRVRARGDVSTADIERAVDLVKRHDPRRAVPGLPRRALVAQRDVDLLLEQAARRLGRGAAARATIEPFTLRLEASVALPLGLWLNVDARWREAPGLPALEGLRLGRLPVPGAIAEALAEAALRHASARVGLQPDLSLLREVVREVSLARGVAVVRYVWPEGGPQRLFASLVPAPDQQRLRAYQERLAALTRGPEADEGWLPLTALLPPMFELARQRTAAGGDAAAENRAAIAVLAFHAAGRSLSALIPDARRWDRPRWLRVTLHGRWDFPQHFLVSALLAAEGSSPLADAVGLYKEVRDARQGSGFSFNDIAADRAGTRFGERAVRDAAGLQAALAGPIDEGALLPDVSDLPEFLSEDEFVRRFGGVGAPAYREMLADIEARLARTPLLR